jgi:hypothetical protein
MKMAQNIAERIDSLIYDLPSVRRIEDDLRETGMISGHEIRRLDELILQLLTKIDRLEERVFGRIQG